MEFIHRFIFLSQIFLSDIETGCGEWRSVKGLHKAFTKFFLTKDEFCAKLFQR